MEIPNWLKGLTPKKIAPDSSDAPAGESGQPAETGAIPASVVPGKTGTTEGDVKEGMGQFAEGVGAAIEDKAQEYANRILAGEDTSKMGVPMSMRERTQQIVDQMRKEQEVLVAPSPIDDEHFFGTTEDEIEAEKARRRAEMVAPEASPVVEMPVVTAKATDAVEAPTLTPEMPVELPAAEAPSPENDSLKSRAREDFTRRGYKYIDTDENGVEIWYHVKEGRGEINPTVTTEHQERQHDEWFDQALEAAKAPEDATQALESKLTELEQRAGEKAKKIDSVEAERDRLRSEMAAIEETAREKLSRGKSPSSLNRREYLIKTRNRYWEIKSRLDAINGTDDQVGELDSAREELSIEGSAQKSRRLRRIRQVRGEIEQFQDVIDNPMLLDEYRRLRSGMDSITTNPNLPSAVVEAYKRETQERLLELESQLPAELVKLVQAELHPVPQQFDAEAKDVSISAIEKAGVFEENMAYGRAAIKLKELIENKFQEIKLNPPVPEPVKAPMPEEAREAAVETPEQRFERRKQGFAGALAELDRARNDTGGTEREQKVRLAEAFNQTIGEAMEFMEEGDAAKGVVREFFAGALGTSGGRKLTEVAVRSRMDEIGVLQGGTPEEKKKKLEEAGLLGLLELLLELGMSFSDKSIGAVVTEVQSVTGGGR